LKTDIKTTLYPNKRVSVIHCSRRLVRFIPWGKPTTNQGKENRQMIYYKKIPTAALKYLLHAIHDHRERLISQFDRYINTFEGERRIMRQNLVSQWFDLITAYRYFAQENPLATHALEQEINQTTELLKSDNELRILIEKEEAFFDELKQSVEKRKTAQ